MARIRCHYSGCIHLEDGYCGTPSVELDPEDGCRMFSQSGGQFDDDWADEEVDEMSQWEDEGYDEWVDEDDDFQFDLNDNYD